MKSALDSEVPQPILAICCSSGHCSEHFVADGLLAPYWRISLRPTWMNILDFNNLFDRLRSDPISLRCPGVCSYDDPTLESEGEGGGAMGELDGTIGIRVIIR